MYFMDGNEAIAHASVIAGCSFFAGYPITPATSIYHHMLKLLPSAGGVCLQGEDEIASIGFCLGASMAGKKVMTATSGPGISLFSEQISFAIGGEIPIVIVDVQRLGPSTGSATKGADGDIQFLHWGSSGGIPVIVLVPVDVLDCYLLTLHAFNLAEQYRCPVFIASNKEVAMTRESVDLDTVTFPETVDRQYWLESDSYQPFSPIPETDAPYFLPIGGETLVRQTSSTHGVDGYITIDSVYIGNSIDRMARKLKKSIDKYTYYDLDEMVDAELLMIVYGVTSRAAKEAVKELRHTGHAVSLLILKTLYPVAETLIRSQISRVREVLVVEMNLGQYVLEIERLAGNIPVRHYGRMDGELISPEVLVEVASK